MDYHQKNKKKKKLFKNLSRKRGLTISEENQKEKEEKIVSEEEKNRLVKGIEEQIKNISKCFLIFKI